MDYHYNGATSPTQTSQRSLKISPSESELKKTMKKAMSDNLSNCYTGPILDLQKLAF